MSSRLIGLLAAAGLALSSPAMAEEGHDHDKAGSKHADKGHDDKSHFKAKTPADLKEAWSQIATGLTSAEADLAANKLEPVHEFGEQLEATLHFMAENSTMVTGEAKGRLDSSLKQMDKIADALHHAAEDKDTAKIGQEIKKAKSLLPLIEAQYPAGTLN